MLIVPVGGGGLISGCATVAAAAGVRVVGVEPEAGNDTQQSLARGERVTIPIPRTIADGQQAPAPGVNTFPIVQRLVSEIVTVTDDEIRAAMAVARDEAGLTLEPSGATALAAWLEGRVTGARPGIILSGGNVDPDVSQRCYRPVAARRGGAVVLLGVAALAVVGVVALLGGGEEGRRCRSSRTSCRPRRGRGASRSRTRSATRSSRRAEFEARAAAGNAHVLYALSPGGAEATAERVARLRPAIDDGGEGGRRVRRLLEALVFLESAGRPDALTPHGHRGRRGPDADRRRDRPPSLLGMQVDVERSRAADASGSRKRAAAGGGGPAGARAARASTSASTR